MSSSTKYLISDTIKVGVTLNATGQQFSAWTNCEGDDGRGVVEESMGQLNVLVVKYT